MLQNISSQITVHFIKMPCDEFLLVIKLKNLQRKHVKMVNTMLGDIFDFIELFSSYKSKMCSKNVFYQLLL